MGFKSDFYKLIKKYKNLPYMDDHFTTDLRKGDKYYEVVLEIQKKTYSHHKPTHGSVESLIKFMMSQGKVKWWPADDPSNDPPLIQFCYEKRDQVISCSVAAFEAFKIKMYSKKILQEVERIHEQKT